MDEEYLRDLLGPPALDYPDGRDVHAAAQRAWRADQGKRRLRMILKTAKPIQLRSPSGLYIGRAIGVQPDKNRISRVALKIAQGVIFLDTLNASDTTGFVCAPIPSGNVPAERKRELLKGNPYWQAISFEGCKHTNFSDSVAVRRVYIPLRMEPGLTCQCLMLLMLLSQSFVIAGEVALDSVPKDFQMVAPLDDLKPGDHDSLAVEHRVPPEGLAAG